jgi:hypothetical protein
VGSYIQKCTGIDFSNANAQFAGNKYLIKRGNHLKKKVLE